MLRRLSFLSIRGKEFQLDSELIGHSNSSVVMRLFTTLLLAVFLDNLNKNVLQASCLQHIFMFQELLYVKVRGLDIWFRFIIRDDSFLQFLA